MLISSFWQLFQLLYSSCNGLPLVYHTSWRLSRGFSKVFLKFSWFYFVLMWSRKFRSLGFTSFSIISYLFKFVKRFLKFIFWTAFQAFKIWFNSLSLLSKQLIYYITLFSICQEVFQTFLKFFLDFRSLCDVFKPFSRQLLYYTLFVRKSQLLFQKYLKKFSKNILTFQKHRYILWIVERQRRHTRLGVVPFFVLMTEW